MNQIVEHGRFYERSQGTVRPAAMPLLGKRKQYHQVFLRGLRRCVASAAAAVLCLSWLVLATKAQDAGAAAGRSEEAVSPGRSCLSADLLSQISVRSHETTVTAASRLRSARSEEGSEAAADSISGAAKAYHMFELAARKGEPAAQVNLAIAVLASWGGAPNASKALFWLNEAAEREYALAYFDLGILYQGGCGVRQDYAEAARYFELGAEAGHAPSQMNLGYLYDQGLGVARDRMRAAEWYRKAAEAGLAEAQFNLADLYVHGEGVRCDEPAAFLWFQKAAHQGHASAQIMLAAMYAQGRGTTRDVVTAYAWLEIAAQRGDARAQKELAGLAAQLNPAEIAQAKAVAATLAQSGKQGAETAALH